MKKEVIKNRKGQKIVVLVEEVDNPKGLAFVMHGLGGFKEAPHIETFAESFKERNYTVIRFDTTNAFGESDGKYEEATFTNYYEDFKDVIDWAKGEKWYQEPFVLAGHSLGGFCSILYAEKYPDKVLALAPISPVISGKLSIEAHEKYEPEELKKWKETDWRVKPSSANPKNIKRLPWSHMENRLKYDLLPGAHKLTMPALIIVGENDTSTPPEHQKILYDKLPGPKEFHIIKNAPHTFIDKKHLTEIKQIFLKWIDSYL